MNVDAGFVHHS